VVLDDPECVELMTRFIAEQPALWFEDIGDDGGTAVDEAR